MAYVPAANVAMVELRYVFDQEQCENTLYFQASASLSPSLMTTLAADITGWWQTNIKPVQVDNLKLFEVHVTDLTTATSPTVTYNTGLPQQGLLTGDPLPHNCALCISFRTANRGRSSRGRNYHFGFEEGDVTGSLVDQSLVDTIVAAYATLIGAGSLTSGLQWCVVSRFGGGVARTAALVQPVTAVLAIDNVIDSQRRRLPGRGR